MWHENVDFDGIWLDMNEVSSFCTGSCGSASLGLPTRRSVSVKQEALESKDGVSPGRNVNYPPYAINNDKPGHSLGSAALSPNATHFGDVEDYDVHNLWGYGEEEATYQALVNINPGKMPFIISRSTFAGSGRYTGHWGGDNYSLWQYLYLSIPQALQFSLFGIPMFGVDTCGFADDTTEELCGRWMQLSAFFPFYRNHNSIGNIPQEPYHWASVTEASKTAMAIRYALLPYIYTLFYLAHTTGSTVMRAIAWEFNNDPSLAAADRQFLLGPSLMIVPVLDENATTVDGVFPGLKDSQVWYDWYTQTQVEYAKPGVNTTVDAPLGHIPVFIRGGSVLPTQQPAMLTREVRNSPWSLLVALGQNGSATGSVYIDDGESITPSSSLFVSFAAQASRLTASGAGSFQDTNPLANVTVLGVDRAPQEVLFNNKRVEEHVVDYNASSKVLVINGLSGLTKQGAFIENWTLEW
jgi:alpha-glucosidase